MPEEDVLLLDMSFMSQSAEATMRVPTYARWLEEQDHTPAYAYLRKLMQLLLWQQPAKRWVLKSPHHMEYLDVILRVFPEATIVQTHRDPRKTMASFTSMVCHGAGVFSDVVLNIDLPTQDANGIVDILSTADMFRSLTSEIDELEVFPMASVAYRPVEGLTVRGAYSETAARPSFRELSYYASIVPGIPDRIVGNPFLQLSNVQSVDGRVEYFWGDVGDLLAVSAFYKTIANPIELVILRDFSVAGAPLFEGPFRVYRNNENTAELKGIELEARVNLGNLNRLGDWTIPGGSFLEYLTIGGNYTYIDAEIARSPFELQLANEFYQATEDDVESGQILATSLPLKRRLFNQPEWTANADITFDQPDWGTTFTLSVFAISDVLNAAGGPALGSNGDAEGFTLDEYIAGFYQLDMVVGQSFEIPRVPGRWTVRTSIKNLTDSERGLIHDPAVTTQVYQWRTFTVGRDYSFTLQYQTTF